MEMGSDMGGDTLQRRGMYLAKGCHADTYLFRIHKRNGFREADE